MRKIINVPLKKLREYENNPRNNTLAIDKVKASIERLGFMFPIVIDMNYTIVAGHTRRAACEALKIKSVPCIMVDDLDQEQIDLFRYVDNKSSEYASWDYEKLASELQKIDTSVALNEMILDSFDFDLQATEFDIIPTAVPVATFNFMGDDYKKADQNTAINIEREENETDLDEGEEYGEDDYEYGGAPEEKEGAERGEFDIRGEEPAVTVPQNIAQGAMTFGGEDSKAPVIHLFRCGSRRFIISEIEEARLLSAYNKYMGEVYPESTFIQYLLGGRENVEVQPESAD